MAKLPSLITNSLTEEALNYSNSGSGKIEIKQTFEVTQNNNFTYLNTQDQISGKN